MKLFQNKKVLVIVIIILVFISIIFWKSFSIQERSHSPAKKTFSQGSKAVIVQPNNLSVQKSTVQKFHIDKNKSPQIAKLDKKEKVQILKFAVIIDQFEKVDLAKTSELQYAQILSLGLTQFPRKADIQKLSSDHVHTIPVPLSLAGEYLGHLKTHLEKEPKLMNNAMKFYSNCGVSKAIMLSVKALCLANLIKYSKSTGKTVDYSLYDRQVIELAKYAEMGD